MFGSLILLVGLRRVKQMARLINYLSMKNKKGVDEKMASRTLRTINKLAMEIAAEVDGLLDGEEPEPSIFKKA